MTIRPITYVVQREVVVSRYTEDTRVNHTDSQVREHAMQTGKPSPKARTVNEKALKASSLAT